MKTPGESSELAKQAAVQALDKVHLYPDGSAHVLTARLASLHALDPSQFVLGNGSNEIIELLGHVFLEPGDELVCGEFAFVVYKLVALLMGAKPVEVPMPELAHDLRPNEGCDYRANQACVSTQPQQPNRYCQHRR